MRTMKHLCQVLRDLGGSDLHLTVGSPPRVRIDGRLSMLEGPPLTAGETRRLVSEIHPHGHGRDGGEPVEEDLGLSLPDLGRFRCHVYAQGGSPAFVIRAIPLTIPTFDELGLPATALRELAGKSHGLVLVTGPSGCGKSTTVSAMIEFVNQHRAAHVVTIENPIEFRHSHKVSLVDQRQIGRDAPDVQRAVHGVLRQDADVVSLGELTTRGLVHSALDLAESGHLTLGTFRTPSVAHTLHRLIASYVPSQQAEARSRLALALEGILSQRLIPVASGKGRVLAIEVLIPTPGVRSLIRDDKIPQIYSTMQTGQAKYGMQTMNQALVDLCKRRVVTMNTALAASPYPAELSSMLERFGRGDRANPSSLARLQSK